MNADKPRWIYRFENYKRGFSRLRAAIELAAERPLTELEKIGTVQCFEFTWELAWKTLKDYLESLGLHPETATPAATVKAAFEAGVIDDGEVWMKALDARNKMAHAYDMKAFEAVIAQIEVDYLAMFDAFYMDLLEKITARPLHG